MSLYIDATRVHGALLADGWHGVESGTFDLDAYEIHDGHGLLILTGSGREGRTFTGFRFQEPKDGMTGGAIVSGPVTSLLAVRHYEGPSPAEVKWGRNHD